MRTLFEKDLRLILSRKSTMLIFILIGILFTWSFSSSFSGAYLTMLGTMLALSTISFDDSDNCMAFLFTLPCTRKQYVLEKYLFVYGTSLFAGLVGMVIIILSSIIKGDVVNGTILIEIIASEIPILVMTGGLMIPLQLKYGPEKSRIVLMSILGVVIMAGVLIGKSTYASTILEQINQLMDGITPFYLLVALIAVLVIITILSILVTSKIMNDKEF
ncbi:MAG: ABC-2 transporter permease [Firmicutes bacterium]|nr:ABC-2 transporter permease [Bacillota bacterium]